MSKLKKPVPYEPQRYVQAYLGGLTFKFVINFFDELDNIWISLQYGSARFFVKPPLSWVSQRTFPLNSEPLHVASIALQFPCIHQMEIH